MLTPATRQALDRYWSGVFGCDPAALRPLAPAVFPCPPGDDYRGVYAMEFGAAPVALLPPEMLGACAEPVAALLAAGLPAGAEPWRGVFGDGVDAVIGPAALSYADRLDVRPPGGPADAHMLSADHLAAVEALRRACPAADWEQGGIDPPPSPAAGVWVGGELAALASYEVWGDVIAHVSVIAHPAHRGRGHAAAAVARVTADAFGRGLIAQYRALESNVASLAVAKRLGYQPLARSVAVRLRGA